MKRSTFGILGSGGLHGVFDLHAVTVAIAVLLSTGNFIQCGRIGPVERLNWRIFRVHPNVGRQSDFANWSSYELLLSHC